MLRRREQLDHCLGWLADPILVQNFTRKGGVGVCSGRGSFHFISRDERCLQKQGKDAGFKVVDEDDFFFCSSNRQKSWLK